MASDIFTRLAEPFDPAVISWRPGSMSKDKSKAKALCYLDARDVMRRLDDVIGPASWQDRYEFHGARTVCYLSIRIDGEWITKADGAGDSDVEAEKGAISDAFKRAAVKFGVGRYLYDIDSPWVRINQWKQIEDDELPRLRALLRGDKPKSAYRARKDGDWPALAEAMKQCNTFDDLNDFLAANIERIDAMPDSWRVRWNELVETVRDGIRGRMAA